MSKGKIAILLVWLIVLVSLFPFGHFSNSQASSVVVFALPTQNQVITYAESMIGSYDNLVAIHYSLNPNFDSFSSHFSLYASSKYSFQVILVQTNPNDSTSMTLIFKEVPSLILPNVIIDNQDTFNGGIYTGGLIDISHHYFIFENVGVSYSGNYFVYPLAISIPTRNITNDVSPSASSEANAIFQQDSSGIPSYLLTQVAQTNTSQTSTSQSSQITTQNNGQSAGNLWLYVVLLDLFGMGLILWIPIFALVKDNKYYSAKKQVATEYGVGLIVGIGFCTFLFSPPHDFSIVSVQTLGILFVLIPFLVFVSFRGDAFLLRLGFKRDNQKARRKAEKESKKGNDTKEMKDRVPQHNPDEETKGTKPDQTLASSTESRSVIENIDSEDTDMENVKGSSKYDTVVKNVRSKRTKMKNIQGVDSDETEKPKDEEQNP